MIELSSNISAYIKSLFGEDFLSNYVEFVESKYPTIIRISESPENHDNLLTSLTRQGIELKKIKTVPNAYEVIKGEENIGKTIEHTLGKYYIQSLSSMIPPLILNPTKDDVVLDLCAAPGSKSTQLAEMMGYKGTLYSNEPNLSRVKALVHNLDKMNTVNMSVIKEKAYLLSQSLLDDIEKDSDAFTQVMNAYKLPKETDDQKKQRSASIQNALKLAAEVPMSVAIKSYDIMDLSKAVVTKGNQNAVTDGMVSAMMARTAVLSALLNVKINLSSIKDEGYVADMNKKVKELEKNTVEKEKEILLSVKL